MYRSSDSENFDHRMQHLRKRVFLLDDKEAKGQRALARFGWPRGWSWALPFARVLEIITETNHRRLPNKVNFSGRGNSWFPSFSARILSALHCRKGKHRQNWKYCLSYSGHKVNEILKTNILALFEPRN